MFNRVFGSLILASLVISSPQLLSAKPAESATGKKHKVYDKLNPNNVIVKIKLTVGGFDLKGKKVEGKLIKKAGKLHAEKMVVKSQDLKTGMSLRDKHTWDRLGHEIIATNFRETGPGRGTTTFTIGGVSKDVNFTFWDSGKGKACATFKINPYDFGIHKRKKLKYLGVGVKKQHHEGHICMSY